MSVVPGDRVAFRSASGGTHTGTVTHAMARDGLLLVLRRDGVLEATRLERVVRVNRTLLDVLE
jgi:uncharacterized protein YijF (DUF1287 family)